ncbi:MAG: UDP-N-acetylmuramoyl-tripeptide--D-alanyl-D-alanine ligase [Actinobacteria bacterium]|nr:UDP-N-acetylmuramoyl-tripeptide--D-alanyl-D-alanine ligase [Actinomycetota bacterium]
MIALTLRQIAEACDGRLEGGEPGTVIRRVSTDSRSLAPGDLFVGISGQRHDGSAFAAAAAAAGAAAVAGARLSADLPVVVPRIVVDDGLTALQRLAAAVRRRARARVVAVTGSAGKTSTKDILAALLRPVAATVATQGNFNNEVGVPLTLLSIEETTDVAVVELAMRGLGQIRELAKMVAPDVGVITNIAPVHLELVGGIEDVAAAKAELLEGLEEHAVVVPGDEALLRPYLERYRGRVVTFGGLASDVRLVSAVPRADGTRAVVAAGGQRVDLDFNFSGDHYLTDALAAVGAFVELGFPLAAARQGAGRVVFSENRGQVVALGDGGLLLNDAYNANPVAMRAAIDHLLQLAGERPVVAVLGDMYELGPDSARFHAAVGRYAAERGVRLVAVGELGRDYLTGAPDETWQATVDDCVKALPAVIPAGSAVLVKASRALRLERVARALVELGEAYRSQAVRHV